MATIRQFKNGRIKDPVARRVEERRLQRLRGIKSSVKSRGLNKSKRASMRRLDRRQHTNSTNDLGNLSMPPPRRSGINDVTNDSQWQGLHDSASELLKRAQKHAARTSQRSKIQSLQDEFDEQSESADENVLDASFDTLWNFHAQKNNLTSGDGDGDGDLEDAATTLIAPLGSGSGSSGSGSGNGGGTQTARSESVQSEGGKSTKSVKLDDAAAEAFQNAWSAATPIGLHDDALDDSRVEGTNSHHPGLFGDERKHKIKKSKARTKRGRKQMDLTGVKGGQRPSLSKMERGWKSRGLPTSAASLRDTVRDCRQSPREADEEDEDEDEEGERERERERDHHDAENHNLTTAMQQPTLLTFDILKRKRREESRLREENQVLLNRLADVNGDGDGVIDMDAMMNGDMDEDLSEFQDLNEGDRVEQQQYSQQKTRMKKGRNNKGASGSNNNSPLLPMPPLAASKSRTNLFRSNGVSGTKVPHYSTRTKTNLAKTLKPMIRKKVHEDDRDEDKGARGSWRGGGSADPHAQSERERVLEVKKREQKQAREAARNWRKRTEAHRRKQEEKAATAVGSTSPTAPAAKATKSPSPSKRNPGTIQTLQNEKNEAQAMLAELMSTEADTKMDEQLHTHRNEEEREEEEEETQTETETQHDVNSLIPTPLKNSQKYNYMDRDLHLDSPMDDAAVEAEDSPFLQRQDDTEGPESNTPEKDNINNVQDIEEEDGRGSVSFSVPQLDLGDVSPDIQETSDDEEEEDDALFD